MENLGKSIERLIGRKKGKGRLPPAAARGALGVDVVEATPQSSQPSSGALNWPITEEDIADREYHPEVFYQSPDGIFVMLVSAPSKMVFTDAYGQTGEMHPADPYE
ncbi:MAG: hypothetical protein V2J89_11065 [Halieaceae bacterium]|jgi:hypothetical protein|nr:hypothetical protein [Halieaceae bacterium]